MPPAPLPGERLKGRVGIYEVLRIQEDMATAISKGASTDVIRQLALESGMVTLLGYSLELVRRGETTLEEVGRMVLTDSGLESERRARALSTMTFKGCRMRRRSAGGLARVSLLPDTTPLRSRSWV